MKKTVCAVALSVVMLSAPVVFAAENPGPGNCPCSCGPQSKPDFAAMKADIQKMLSHKIAQDQKALACVKAAQNIEALETCRPPHREMRRPPMPH
jgi:hypothetical protein